MITDSLLELLEDYSDIVDDIQVNEQQTAATITLNGKRWTFGMFPEKEK